MAGTPENLMTKSEFELRKEYTQLRDIAQKRIKRLQDSEFKDSATARRWADGVPKLKELNSKEDIVFALYDLKSFLKSPYSTIRGQRSIRGKVMKKLKKHYPEININDANYNTFTRIMNAQTDNKIEKLFGSNRAVALFKVLEDKKVANLNPFISNPASMAYWLDNLENLEAVDLPKGRYRSAKAFKDLVESEIYHGRDRRPTTIPGVEDIIQGKRTRSGRRRNTRRNRRT